MAFVLILLVVASGTLLTYLFDEDATLAERVCVGAGPSLAMFGLVGYVFSAWLGFTLPALLLSSLVIALPLVLLRQASLRKQVARNWIDTISRVRGFFTQKESRRIGHVVFWTLLMVMLWLLFRQAVFEQPDGIYTGVYNNYGDLPLHIGIVTGFLYGENFPPEHPELAGTGLTYPFLSDFVTAMLMRAGADLTQGFFLVNIVLALALAGVMYRFTSKLTGNSLAASLAPWLVFLSGGLGFFILLHEALTGERSLPTLLMNLPHDYTINIGGLRWGNSLTTLLSTQRSMLFGLPLTITVFTLWWQVVGTQTTDALGDVNEDPSSLRSVSTKQNAELKTRKQKSKTEQETKRATRTAQVNSASPISHLQNMSPAMRRMIAAGVIAGLLPLVHTHSFMVAMGVGGCLALLFRRWRLWIAFFAAASLIALPQILWLMQHSHVQGERFIGWHFGWDREWDGKTQNVVWFWFKNTGAFIPLLIWAVWRLRREDRESLGVPAPKRLLLFYLPFTLCFIVPNLIRLAPWVWDNIKVLFYWYVASVPLVALLLARWWRTGDMSYRLPTAIILVTLMLTGGLDVWRSISKATQLRVYDQESIQFAEVIKRDLPTRALIMRAPTHDHPVLLTGRRSLVGYPGHLVTHGLKYEEIEADEQRIYRGDPAMDSLISHYGVEYIVFGPQERNTLQVTADPFINRFKEVGAAGEYRLYKTSKP